MSLDGIPSKNEKSEQLNVIDSLYFNQAGDFWYFDKNNKVVILDDAAEIERERQHFNPDSSPEGNLPKFPRSFRQEEIPTDIEKFLENHKPENKNEPASVAADQILPTKLPALTSEPPVPSVVPSVESEKSDDTGETIAPDAGPSAEAPSETAPDPEEEPAPLDPNGFTIVKGMKQGDDNAVAPTGADYWIHKSTKLKKYSAEEIQRNNDKWAEKQFRSAKQERNETGSEKKILNLKKNQFGKHQRVVIFQKVVLGKILRPIMLPKAVSLGIMLTRVAISISRSNHCRKS
ncbi:MAG: hypothetical protein JWO50_212 [Candidatus Kaiserbacteria bacterium]|nr:hypothetical protein [Candidatus Kaiserbacteria bacterium]